MCKEWDKGVYLVKIDPFSKIKETSKRVFHILVLPPVSLEAELGTLTQNEKNAVTWSAKLAIGRVGRYRCHIVHRYYAGHVALFADVRWNLNILQVFFSILYERY